MVSWILQAAVLTSKCVERSFPVLTKPRFVNISLSCIRERNPLPCLFQSWEQRSSTVFEVPMGSTLWSARFRGRVIVTVLFWDLMKRLP